MICYLLDRLVSFMLPLKECRPHIGFFITLFFVIWQTIYYLILYLFLHYVLQEDVETTDRMIADAEAKYNKWCYPDPYVGTLYLKSLWILEICILCTR